MFFGGPKREKGEGKASLRWAHIFLARTLFQAGEIFDDEKKDEEDGINSWLDQIQFKDDALRKAQQDIGRGATAAPAPVRNQGNRQTKNVQVGQSDVEKQKEEQKKGKQVDENGVSKHQKYYQYDYFKEWDKFDVDKEIKRLEEEDKKQDEYKSFAKTAADPFESYNDPNDTYKLEAMTPLERRMAAQREKEKGNECMKCGETNAAVQYYSKSLELSPGNHLVLGNRAQAYIGIHCFLQAEMDCDQALAIEPSYTKARYRRAVACKEQGKFAEAIKDLEAVLKEEPEHKTAKGLMAEATKKMETKKAEEDRKTKEAEERARYESAPRRKIAIQEVDEDDEDDEDDGMDKKAMEQARESVKLKKDEEERLLKLEAVRRKKEEGNAAVKKKDFTQAARHYSAAIKLLPAGDKEEAHLVFSNRAHVHLQQGEYALAEADCTAALAANASWAKAHHRRGVARAELGRCDEALTDLEKALKLESDSKQTIDEIRRVRAMQTEQRRNMPAAKRVQIVEVDTDSEGDTDSSDDDVVVINKASMSPARCAGKKLAGDDEGEIIEEDAALVTAAQPQRVKIQIVDEDSEEEEEQEQECVPSGAFTACAKHCGSKPGYVFKMGPSGLGYYLDAAASGCRPAPAAKVAPASPAPSAPAPAANLVKVQIVGEEDDSDDDEAVAKGGGKQEEAARLPSSPHRVRVEIMESDSDDEEHPCTAPPPAAAAAPEENEVMMIPWEANGRDEGKLAEAKAAKEAADDLFKKGLFEQASEGYSCTLALLADEQTYQPERSLCFNNRAACRLQIRDYAATIADCGEVLCSDPDNVKALVRRAMSYEGLERYSKAAKDCREVLSIEFAAGTGLSNMGQKARECLERCKKHAPELRAVPIPTREAKAPRTSRTSPCAEAAALAKDGAAAQADKEVVGKAEREKQLQEQQRETAEGAKKAGKKETKSFADVTREA